MRVEAFVFPLPNFGSSTALRSHTAPQALRLAAATEEDSSMSGHIRKRSRPASTAGQEPVNEAKPVGDRAGEAPAHIEQSDTGDAAGCSPTEIKLKLVLLMMIEGRSQKEIAKHFKVDPRTIRNWQKKLKRLKLGIVENLNPTREIERILVRLTSFEARLREIREDVLARSEFGTVIRCEKELMRLAIQRIGLLKKFGVFDQFRLPLTSTDDPGKQQADLLVEMLESLHSSITEGASDKPSTDEEDD